MHRILLPVFFFWILASRKNSVYFDWRVYLAAIFSILIVYSFPVFLNKTFEMISSIVFPPGLVITGAALIQPRINSLYLNTLFGSMTIGSYRQVANTTDRGVVPADGCT